MQEALKYKDYKLLCAVKSYEETRGKRSQRNEQDTNALRI